MRNDKCVLAYRVRGLTSNYQLESKVIPIANYIESQGGSVMQIEGYPIADLGEVIILFKYNRDSDFPYEDVDDFVERFDLK